ncbi:MAG: leucine-rich repeat protein, partial [Clostridia bacterium]|nr:leucine-rich repeat protein [Clostridia bacterium]
LFNLNSFKLDQVDGVKHEDLVTNKLGLHTMTVKYSTEDTNGELTADIVYAVVLEADNSIFSFEVVNEEKKTARITACTNKTADTLVLPDKYTKDGITYRVTEIGNSVFENFTALKTVYLPATLEKIGSNAFAGCTLLEELFTSTQTVFATTQIPDADFEDLQIEITEIGTIEVTELLFTIIPSTLTVPATFTWSEKSEDGITEIEYQATPVFSDTIFAKCKGTIWLYDSEYNRAYAAAHLEGKKVEFYTEEDNRVPAAQSRFKLNTDKFVATEVHKVKYAKLLTLENITPGADGNIVVTPSFDMPVAYQDEYLIANTESGETKLVWVEKDAEYAAPSGWEILKSQKNVPIYEKDYISATAARLQMPEGFDGFVYLPDTIYNITVIVDDTDQEYAEMLTIYKSGSTTLVSTLDYVPDTLTYIGSTAFQNCVNLKDIEFGEGTNLQDICTKAFEGCTELEQIIYGKNTADWQEIDLGTEWDQDTGAYVIKCKDGNLPKA